MKIETKNRLLVAFCAPVLAIIFGSAVLTVAGTWNDRFATKEYVSSNYISKDSADKYYLTKEEGATHKATIAALEKQVGYMRDDVKTMVAVILRMDKKIDKYIILSEQIAERLASEPQPQPPEPVAIVENEKR